MTRNPQQSTEANFAFRLKVFYAALFASLGVQLPFLPLWLAAKGLDAGLIGAVLALPMVIRIVAIPATARLADRRRALRGVIVVASAGAAVGYGALALTDGAFAIAAVYALASIAYAPVMTLTDAYALRGLAQWRRPYGPVRLWGSAAFIASSLAAGLLLDVVVARELIWAIVATMGLAAVAACVLAPVGGQQSEPSETTAHATSLARSPAFLAVVAAASLVQASHAVYYGFSTIDWRSVGLDGSVIGSLWALGVFAEIVLFALSARLPTAITPTMLLSIGAGGAVLRWSMMAVGPPAAALPALQCLHALSFGATHLGALGFVARAAPAGMGATAQAYLAVALGLVMAAAMAAAGELYERFGAGAYGAMALAALVGGVCALVAHAICRRQAMQNI